jgi:hypothetical protein
MRSLHQPEGLLILSSGGQTAKGAYVVNRSSDELAQIRQARRSPRLKRQAKTVESVAQKIQGLNLKAEPADNVGTFARTRRLRAPKWR